MGELVTIKGQALAASVTRIDLFDGKFTTGYRLKEFNVMPRDITTREMVIGRLMTGDLPHSIEWNWDNNFEVGWSAYGVPLSDRFGVYNRVDEDVVIVEDLFIDMTGDTGELINYLIVLERLTFPVGIGAMNMVRNMSQG
tara:strand:- start:617 stop:1036 length:420 start_codon:yes stop_codon:yes gene_type:complete